MHLWPGRLKEVRDFGLGPRSFDLGSFYSKLRTE